MTALLLTWTIETAILVALLRDRGSSAVLASTLVALAIHVPTAAATALV